MSGLIDPGRITLRLSVDADVIVGADVRSQRPLAMASRFVGRPVCTVIEAVGLLHAVCGRSHAAALRLAAAAASDETIAADERRAWTIRLAAERIGEHLRELYRTESDAGRLDRARAAIAQAQTIARSGQMQDGAAAVFTAALRPTTIDVAAAAVDALTAADDATVVAALAADTAFERLPTITDRQPEVGPAARLGGSAAGSGATEAARWQEIAMALDTLAAADGPLWYAAGRWATDGGFAAVESPRGRLYYVVRIGDDGRLVDARVLAPTEWNFHPTGPFIRSLIGWRPAGDRRAAVVRRAQDFCPCVTVEVEEGDGADA